MVFPLVAAAMRAASAASKAGKAAQAGKAARAARPTGDAATNARKRFYRRAESYLKKAEESTGVTKEKYKALARVHFENAMKTYDVTTTQKFSKPMQRIANQLGVDIEEERLKMKAQSGTVREKIRDAYIKLDETSASYKALKRKSRAAIREAEAEILMKSPVGKRLIAANEDIWKDAARVKANGKWVIDKKKIMPAILRAYNADSLADLLEKIEEIAGEDLYKDFENEVMYEAVKIQIMIHDAMVGR